jgi:hypothetical protein
LLSEQLVAAGEHVVDVPATLAARVRLVGTGRSNKNDPNDARSVAVAARRAPQLAAVNRSESCRQVTQPSGRRHPSVGLGASDGIERPVGIAGGANRSVLRSCERASRQIDVGRLVKRDHRSEVVGSRQVAESVAAAASVGVADSVAVAGSGATAHSVAVAGSVATADSVAISGSAATAGSAAVAGSAGTTGSVAVAGSAGTAGSVAVAGSAATVVSIGVIASLLTFLGVGIRNCVATVACIRCRRCIACLACIDCVDCIGCVGCVGLRGAVGRRGARALLTGPQLR